MTDAVLAEINETLQGILHELQKMNEQPEPQKIEQPTRRKGKRTKEDIMRDAMRSKPPDNGVNMFFNGDMPK